MTRQTFGLFLSIAAVLGFGMLNTTGSANDTEKTFAVTSQYLTTKMLGGHRIQLHGSVKDLTASLYVDPNICGLNEFGDVTFCTLMAAQSVDVRLVKSDLVDESGADRKLFNVLDHSFEGELSLVVSKDDQPILLIWKNPNDQRFVIPLAEQPNVPAAEHAE